MSLHTCPDLTEAVPLESSLGLYLKPVSRIKINVQLPRLSAQPGQSISSWHVMERIKETVRPDTFLSLKALKIAARVIQFEGELETKATCDRALARLKAAHSLDVSGFAERLPIRAAHAACPGPTRHDWESFFRDAKGVNEMRPGERPDTVHLLELPSRWFGADRSGDSGEPSEKLLRKAFGTFGKIRRVEALRRSAVSLGDGTFGKTGSLLQGDSTFEAYIQYEEYVEFSIAMEALRGKKLLYKEPDGKAYSADIQVDFDRTNYLSDRCIKLREAEAKKLDCLPSVERTKSCKDNGERSLKPTTVQKSNSAGAQGDRENVTDKSLDEKEKSGKFEKKQSEAKLLLKELLYRAEKHKRKTDAELEMAQPKSQKELQELKRPTKSQKAEHFETGSDAVSSKMAKNSKTAQKAEYSRETCSDRDAKTDEKPRKMPKVEHSKMCSDRDALNAKMLPSVAGTQELAGSEKRTRRRDESEPVRLVKKQRVTRELPKEHRKKTQPFYEAKKAHREELSAKKPRSKEKEHSWKSEERESSLEEEDRRKREKLILQERILKEKLLKNLKLREEKMREELRKGLAGRRVLKSVLVGLNKKS